MAMIMELTLVDEQGNTTVYHPMTEVKCVRGLAEALENMTQPLLSKDGGAMTGELDMSGNSVKNLPDPEEPDDPVTLSYMENYVTEEILGGEW